jgi:hypothetical protein
MRSSKLTTKLALQFYRDRIQPRLRNVGGCWTIPVRDNGNGYKYIHVRPSGNIAIHVVVCVAFHRPLRAGEMALHTCDNRGCCRPQHVFPGTQADNMHDMDAKGRRRTWHPTGELNPAAKLSRDQVVEIRRSKLSGREVAKAFGVSQQLVSAIHCKQVWSKI